MPSVYNSPSLILKQNKNGINFKSKIPSWVLCACSVCMLLEAKVRQHVCYWNPNVQASGTKEICFTIRSGNSKLELLGTCSLTLNKSLPYIYVSLTICYMFITKLTCLSELWSSLANVCWLKEEIMKGIIFSLQDVILIHVLANHSSSLHNTFKSLIGTHTLVFLCHIKSYCLMHNHRNVILSFSIPIKLFWYSNPKAELRRTKASSYCQEHFRHSPFLLWLPWTIWWKLLRQYHTYKAHSRI